MRKITSSKHEYTLLDYKGFEELLEEEEELFNGLHYLFVFDNNYEVSVIKHDASYGHENDLFEIMVTAPDNRDLDPIGWQTNKEVLEKLEEVKGEKRRKEYGKDE